MRYLVIVGLYVALAAYCVTDVLNRPEREPHRIHKALWVVLILILPYLGAAIWLVVRRGSEGNQRPARGSGAPDDDPEYLSWLRDQARRRRRQGGDS